MTELVVNDRQGRKILKFQDALQYHGRFHRAGVALGWKFLQASMQALEIDELQRFRSSLIVGATPPGVVDCLEFVTRAFSRQRAIFDPGFGSGACKCSGILSFSLRTTAGTVTGHLRDGVIPDDFAATAKRIDAGLCPPAEALAWQQRSDALAQSFMEQRGEDLYQFDVGSEAMDPKGQPDVFAFTPDTSSLQDLRVRDGIGEITIPFQGMMDFHDKDHFAGIVLAHKLFTYLVYHCWQGESLDRDEIHVRCGLNPPGLIDCFEYVLRAGSRRRCSSTISDMSAPKSPFGSFSFQFSRGDDTVSLRLKDGLLPEDFASIGKKVNAGLASEKEITRWNTYKFEIGKVLIDMKSEDILDRID
ncbi:hypothetical protein [uncultured Cohaesibacter sp.]|uniref:hypothetical protein n=1 Tax=uncultured Cohaesibacter sp. TaxID=1002546 RepID=UPI00292E4137|nr:hypothetical protein [uncultured Cohaesibacter sp.]